VLASSLSFLTPRGGLLALAVGVPLAGLALSAVRNGRVRERLGLPAPGRDRTGVALSIVPLLLGLAASQPALQGTTAKRFRTDAQALYVFDVSGSMDAASGPHAPTRLEQAQSAAINLRNASANVPSGVATLTTQMLPELLPTTDVATFDSTVQRVIGIEQPPPPLLSYGALATSFAPLSFVRGEGYFGPRTKHRLIVLLTDGESSPYDPQATATALTQPATVSLLSGLSTETDWPVALLILRVGSSADHIYAPDGTIDAAYRGEPHADAIVSNLATLARGAAYTPSSLGGAEHAMQKLLGSGKEITRGRKPTTRALARYFALAALLAAGLVIWRRNLTESG
jgi:hypothetical protein